MTERTDAPVEQERSSERCADSETLVSNVGATYAVLAECWREPTEKLVEVAEAGELTPVVGDFGSVDIRDLRTEYTRLFIGPAGPPCPPYESVYRDGSDSDGLGPVMGPSTTAVTRWYDEFGVRLAPDHSDLPDHIATELEFAAYLAKEGFDEYLDQFRDEHLTAWTAEFLTRVENETREPFYEVLAATTREVLAR
ncbi:TorD/DmsD family molecular chaperone [Halomicrobium urmianum]|uniref:TorD/DmsD family molecular chaperone n=1 Tax=Halomicrobium urmianum TaxID=1586233 RepID=UPI001CD99188|nr:molecular chaperone TorD family protein [Halomicrobium urmianum]